MNRQEKKDDLNSKLREVSFELFCKKGYKNTTMRDIANASNIALGTTYNYYKTKSELLFEMIRSNYKDALESLKKYVKNPNANCKEGIFEFFNYLFDIYFEYDKGLWKEFLASSYESDGFNLWDLQKPFISLLIELVKGYKEKDEILNKKDAEIISSVLFSLYFVQFLRFINTTVEIETIYSTLKNQISEII